MEEEVSLADSFKESLFAFEAEDLPEPLKIARDVVGPRFRKYPEAATTLVQVAGTMDEAARLIDLFKARTCGSAYSLAVINLTNFPSQAEFEFLMRPEVLGDPRTIFLCSLRGLNGDIYRLARAKVEIEARLVSEGKAIGTPSCMDNYSPANRDEKAELVAEAAAAYIRECDFRARARPGVPVFDDEAFQALRVLKKSETSFYGLRPGSATRFMRIVPPKR